MMQSDRADPHLDESGPVDKLVIQLRAYVEGPKPKVGKRRDREQPSDWTLIFDTETTTDPSQRLRFGAYQLRERGSLVKRGVFHSEDREVFSDAELSLLNEVIKAEEPSDAGELIELLTRTEFVETIFFPWAQAGATIIGFNLPFDLSRLALEHAPARRGMKGGFSFVFSRDEKFPNVRVKHLSQRAQFIDFAGAEATSARKSRSGSSIAVDRGFFVDVRTFAAALTSESHSLESLSNLLGIENPKRASDDHGRVLAPEYVRYALADVKATWECYHALKARFDAYGLTETGAHELISPASLGKAFLRAMNIKSWREVQPDFSPMRLGHIMSSYFGGRAEVHIRRTIVPVIHCDFLSMYPTVCTLMGLWRFVIASGMAEHDATTEIREFVENCSIDDLQDPDAWRHVAVLVKVKPEDDIFPVRARYDVGGVPGDGEPTPATIGLNRLTSDSPLWFTLTDVLASKFLRGKAPKIEQAIRFKPLEHQAGLRAIRLGAEAIDPASGDFYKDLIERRRKVQSKIKNSPGEQSKALQSEQQALKILANATSYGIFVEVNVEELDKKQEFACHHIGDRPFPIVTDKLEKPGRYFHPLLGTLITGAARLMLALAEKQTLNAGLDWAFCDTDSLAIANVAGLDRKTFTEKVETVRAWFEPLNPYTAKGSILQLEKTNFPEGKAGQMDDLDPPLCLAISAKRYVLFNRGMTGTPIIRKASAHGLGHLVAPCSDPIRGDRISRIGVELWQEQYWQAVILAAYCDTPDQLDVSDLEGFEKPAASRYSATKPGLLRWFDRHNEKVPPSQRVGPFNFLLIFQAKSQMEMRADDPEALFLPAWSRRRPKPAAPYNKDTALAAKQAFNREDSAGGIIPQRWLKSHGRSIVRYHMHPEIKFHGGNFDERGILKRRHVFVLAAQAIGKEADNLQEREVIEDVNDVFEHALSEADRKRLLEAVRTGRDALGVRDLTRVAKISHHTLQSCIEGRAMNESKLIHIATVVEQLLAVARINARETHRLLEKARKEVAREGQAAVAQRLQIDPSFLGKVLSGRKPVSEKLLLALRYL